MDNMKIENINNNRNNNINNIYMTSLAIKKVNNLYNKLNKTHQNYIGIQHSQRIKYDKIINKFSHIHLNNIADPFYPPKIPLDPNDYDLEREYIRTYGELIGIPKNKVWGVTTTSGSEGLLYAIVFGINYFKKQKKNNPIVMYSKAHYIVHRYARMFNLEMIECKSNFYDEISSESIEEIIIKNKKKFDKEGIIIFLTIGTTIKAGIDDISSVCKILKKYNVNYYMHLDAALGGLILPYLDNNPINYKKNKFNSLTTTAHKMYGTPYPIGLFITLDKYRLTDSTEYTSKNDSTLFCSRNGQAVLYMYLYLCDKNSFKERRKEVLQCFSLVKYFEKKLSDHNIPYDRNPNNGLAILFNKNEVPEELKKKYFLVSDDIYTHVFVMIHLNKKIINNFIKDYLKYKK